MAGDRLTLSTSPRVGVLFAIIRKMRRVVVLSTVWLAAFGVAAGCGSGDHGASRVNLEAIEADIGPDLEEQLRDQSADRSLRVRSINCIAKSDQEARCLARVSRKGHAVTQLAIRVDIDPSTGETLWQVEDGGSAVAPTPTSPEQSTTSISEMSPVDGFSTPSRGITCQGFEGADGSTAVRCKALSAMSQSGRVPVAEVKDTGEARIHDVLAPGSTADDSAEIPYGETWPVPRNTPAEAALLKCSSRESGLRCMNADGHGFALSRDTQETF